MSTEKQRPRKERSENADKRRLQLLEATMRSIAANGLANTTLASVAKEAGLSQGVAVFYFKSKTALLTETLRHQYTKYEENWRSSFAKAGSDPLDQLVAIVKADFSPTICNKKTLPVWFAFWGAQKFTPEYAEISARVDKTRALKIRSVCEELFEGRPDKDAVMIAEWINTLTVGYWQKLHVSSDTITREAAIQATMEFIAQLLPVHAERLE